jgi:uncharacterized membrane protein
MEIEKETKEEKDTNRLEAFSDGVFAIAITLLILELKVPALISESLTSPELGKALLQQWPSYFSLVTSFFTILVMWVHHHAIFSHVRKADAWVHFANGCLLLMVTFVPYPTSVLAAYLETPAAKTAAIFYSGTFVLIAICFNLVLRAAFRKSTLLASTPDSVVERSCRNYMFGPFFYGIATVSAFLDVRLCLTLCTLLWIYWTTTAMQNTRV